LRTYKTSKATNLLFLPRELKKKKLRVWIYMPTCFLVGPILLINLNALFPINSRSKLGWESITCLPRWETSLHPLDHSMFERMVHISFYCIWRTFWNKYMEFLKQKKNWKELFDYVIVAEIVENRNLLRNVLSSCCGRRDLLCFDEWTFSP